MPAERRLKAWTLTSLLLGLNVMLLAGCVGSEVARTTSPSGKVDAVLVESSGGATTSFGYTVFVVPAGKSTWLYNKVAWLYAARTEQAYGVNLRWAGPANLTLEYLTAKEADLLRSNVWVAGEQVRIGLRSGVADPKAPSGGMLYNLEGRSR
jgi:hypothetical protein